MCVCVLCENVHENVNDNCIAFISLPYPCIYFLQGDISYPFEKIIFCNIGDCHAMGQKPITFVRQLLTACTNPGDLLYGEYSVYPSDVKERAEDILAACEGNSIGKGYGSGSAWLCLLSKPTSTVRPV